MLIIMLAAINNSSACLCKRLKLASFHPHTSDFSCNIKGNQSSMSKKKVKSKEDFINEPKVVALPCQTYSYGQTPAALCRQHFKEIADKLNMSVEELARGVLDKSVGDQLTMLKDFYKSKFQETDAIYQPLLELYSSKEERKYESAEKSSPKKIKTGEAPAVIVRKKKVCPLILSSESETEDKTNKADVKPSNKTRRHVKTTNKRPAAVNATLSKIQNSIEATIAFTDTFATKDNSVKTLNQEPVIVEFNPDQPEEIKEIISTTSNDAQSSQPKNQPKESTKEPKTMIDVVAGPSKTTTSEEEDLETFLFGKSPAKSKPPPKKKFQQRSLEALSQPTTERPRPSTFDEFDSPPSSQYSTPGLTFESTSCSPSSRQRDLLSVARDIAALQKVVASGKKLSDSVSVSDTIKFTN